MALCASNLPFIRLTPNVLAVFRSDDTLDVVFPFHRVRFSSTCCLLEPALPQFNKARLKSMKAFLSLTRERKLINRREETLAQVCDLI